MRQHTMDCEYPEGCSCGASMFNRLLKQLEAVPLTKPSTKPSTKTLLHTHHVTVTCACSERDIEIPLDQSLGFFRCNCGFYTSWFYFSGKISFTWNGVTRPAISQKGTVVT